MDSPALGEGRGLCHFQHDEQFDLRVRLYRTVLVSNSSLCFSCHLMLFQEWLNNTHGVLMSYRVEHEWIRQLLAKGAVYVTSNMMSNLICAFVYIGLFLFPILLFAFPVILCSFRNG